MATIELGQTVKDVVTGVEGVVIARHEYLYGCTRLSIQPREAKDGRPVDTYAEDEQRFRALDVPNILEDAPLTNKPGGDRPLPAPPAVPAY